MPPNLAPCQVMNESREELVSVRKTRNEAHEHTLGRKDLLFWVFSEIRLNCPPLRQRWVPGRVRPGSVKLYTVLCTTKCQAR